MPDQDDLDRLGLRLNAAGRDSSALDSATDRAKLIAAGQTAHSLNLITWTALAVYVLTCSGSAWLVYVETISHNDASRGFAMLFEAFKVMVLPILTLVIGLYTGRKMGE